MCNTSPLDNGQAVYCGCGTVIENSSVCGISSLSVMLDHCDGDLPVPGQFYMLRAQPSGVLLSRPISLFSRERDASGKLILSFLILSKGSGTRELCALKAGSSLSIFGPFGNSFPAAETLFPDKPHPFLLLIGGGIGIAPPAGFASLLPEGSYDFYACFKSGAYGLDRLRPRNLVIATDDGSVGKKGMLSDVLHSDDIRKYDVVYACGPEPMLAYVQRVCREAGVQCYLSMESRMACGTGACLGCTITTTLGNRRCCTDGPVFPGEILKFPVCGSEPSVIHGYEKGMSVQTADLSVVIGGVRFANPVIAASGTFGYGSEYARLIQVSRLGGICSKGLTLHPRSGNTGRRLCETPAGLINSIGLENPGIPHFIENELSNMLAAGPVVIANLSGSSIEEYTEGARLLNDTSVHLIELNISCPNVKAGGMAFGLDCGAAAAVTRAVRSVVSKPLIVKLSPNTGDLVGIAHAVRREGADALSLVNTFQAMAIDITTGKPFFDNIRAGLSGPAVLPIALRMVYDVVQSMNELPVSERIPVIGLGGIRTWQDALSFIMAGAAAIQVGSATFADPECMLRILDGLESFMKNNGLASLDSIRGCAQPSR